MGVRRSTIAGGTLAVCAWLAVGIHAQQPRPPMTLEPIGRSNEAIFPAYDGWGVGSDGEYYIVLGYMNRNRGETVEVPIGPNNRIEPGGPDYGQPTIFEAGRHKTVFAIKVPKDFGQKKLTWTLVVNGQPSVISFFLNPEYNMEFYREEANGNNAPKIKFGVNEPMLSGPSVGYAQTLEAKVGQPVPLKLWASDAPPEEKNWERIISAAQPKRRGEVPKDSVAIVDGRVIGASGGRSASSDADPDLTVEWKKLRGSGKVTVNPAVVPLMTGGDGSKIVEANATATFSAPGEYVLRAEAVEADDGFDGLCCFSFALVKVVVE